MTVELNKNIKIDKLTIFRNTKGIVVGVTNSSHIKKEFKGDVDASDNKFYYLVKFPEYKEEVCVDLKNLDFL